MEKKVIDRASNSSSISLLSPAAHSPAPSVTVASKSRTSRLATLAPGPIGPSAPSPTVGSPSPLLLASSTAST